MGDIIIVPNQILRRGPAASAGGHSRNSSQLKTNKGELRATHDSIFFPVKDDVVTIGKNIKGQIKYQYYITGNFLILICAHGPATRKCTPRDKEACFRKHDRYTHTHTEDNVVKR